MGDQDIKIGPLSDKDIMFGIMDCNKDLFVNHNYLAFFCSLLPVAFIVILLLLLFLSQILDRVLKGTRSLSPIEHKLLNLLFSGKCHIMPSREQLWKPYIRINCWFKPVSCLTSQIFSGGFLAKL